MIAVVTLLTEGKAYVIEELLQTFAELEAPPGQELRFVAVLAGTLTGAQEDALRRFADDFPLEVHRGPEITEFAEHPWWRSLVAGELRERARQALLAAADDWVFWVDCDVLNLPDTLVRLLAHGRALASGLVLNRLGGSPISGAPITGWQRWDPREIPYQPAPDDYPPLVLLPGRAQEVGWVGFGCFLVRGDLVREISYAPYLSGEAPVWMGEDGWFCSVATERCGQPVLLDNSVCPWHVAENLFGIQAVFEGEQLGREIRYFGDFGAERICVIPRISGLSHRLGELRAGIPLRTDATGRDLSPEELRELAASSVHLDLAEGVELPELRPDGRLVVGIVTPSLALGGAERWILDLLQFVSPARVQWRAVAVTEPGRRSPRNVRDVKRTCPVVGAAELPRLARECDVLIAWGVPDLTKLLGPDPRAQVVLVSHGPGYWSEAALAQSAAFPVLAAVSEDARGAYPAADRERVRVIVNLVDPARLEGGWCRTIIRQNWGVPPRKKVLGYLGRLSGEKRPELLIHALPHLPASWAAVLVGPGDPAPYRALAEELGVSERVFLPGGTPHPAEALRAFDVLAMPSEFEGYAYVTLEAWLLGVPVIATPTGAAATYPHLVRSVPLDLTGADLAAAVRAELADRAGVRERVQTARAVAAEHSPERFGAAWTALICEHPREQGRAAWSAMIDELVSAG